MEEIGIESTMVEAIRSGDKTLEVRLGTPRFLTVQEGDLLDVREDFWYEGKVLESLSHALTLRVTQVLYFESLDELFGAVDFQNAVPAAKTANEAIAAYRPYYTIEDERTYGVVAFTIEPISTE
jgi:ASC-1-like (ASCH) protein